MSAAESGDPISISLIKELLDGNPENDADEVVRRLENVVEDVAAFSRVVHAVFYGHLDIEEKLQEIN